MIVVEHNKASKEIKQKISFGLEHMKKVLGIQTARSVVDVSKAFDISAYHNLHGYSFSSLVIT